MWFVVSSALLVLVYAVLKPLGDGLLDTSAWAAKVMAPPETGGNDFTKQYLRVAQAALLDGWLSNVPFFSYNAGVAASVLAALYHWWAALIVFVVAGCPRSLVLGPGRPQTSVSLAARRFAATG